MYRRLRNRLKDAILLARKRVSWNYRAVVPQYYPKHNLMSFLLPISLSDDTKVDAALVVQSIRVDGKLRYQGYTIYPLAYAYRNARLVAKPISDWLDPENNHANPSPDWTMPTTRELVLAALHARLLPLAALTLRDEVLPERIPVAGLIILRDGQPGEPEVTLSPLLYHYQHRAELEVVVQAGTGRASTFDDLIAAIGGALEADRTLGGVCDWVEAEAPASVDLPIEGAAALKAAVITVILHYTTTGPLA
jgi:hypothetical protein